MWALPVNFVALDTVVELVAVAAGEGFETRDDLCFIRHVSKKLGAVSADDAVEQGFFWSVTFKLGPGMYAFLVYRCSGRADFLSVETAPMFS